MVTINDIAARAGVSRTTVSRYLNQSGYVSSEAAAAIQEAVSSTGYRPSEQAKALRLQRTNVIGVVLPRINTETTSRIIDGLHHVLEEEGYQMLLTSSNLDMEKEIRQLELLESRRVDGIILSATNRSEKLQETIERLRVPVVAVGQDIHGVSSVFYDDYGAASALMDCFMRAGYRKIGFIGVPESDYSVGVMRKQAYLDKMEAAGQIIAPTWMQTADFDSQSGEKAAEAMLEGDDIPTGILAVTDRLAAGAVNIFRRRYQIPDDVAAAGMGATEMSAYMTPALTTVDYQYETAGENAANILLREIWSGHRKIEKSQMTYRLISRDSLRC
ncbi:LacI family DNA-binding transcriptional regulator [Alkalicoccus chagannorensis]|uniref:LacI family DNA-binding transcriptional regulator n=1 Tax=Alkalicoccus chagannorensis TaxID=427072 RepID=UPI0003FDD370|nr:LacI family DNA-binding transcriptional regulator [Alkalicoccus chagannorensis]